MQSLFTILLLLPTLLTLSNCFSFFIEPNTEECFYEYAKQNDTIGIMFEVIRGGNRDIDVMAIDPNGKTVNSEKRQTEGRYSFSAQKTGNYAFCFSNIMSSVTQKIVDVDIEVGLPSAEEEPEMASEDELAPLVEALAELKYTMKKIVSDQKYLKMRDLAHAATNENTNSRVLWWSIFELAILVGSGFFQVFYLRRIFERKHYGI